MRRKVIRWAITLFGLFLLVLLYEHCVWHAYNSRWKAKYLPLEQKQPQELPPPAVEVIV